MISDSAAAALAILSLIISVIFFFFFFFFRNFGCCSLFNFVNIFHNTLLAFAEIILMYYQKYIVHKIILISELVLKDANIFLCVNAILWFF